MVFESACLADQKPCVAAKISTTVKLHIATPCENDHARRNARIHYTRACCPNKPSQAGAWLSLGSLPESFESYSDHNFRKKSSDFDNFLFILIALSSAFKCTYCAQNLPPGTRSFFAFSLCGFSVPIYLVLASFGKLSPAAVDD